jgi:ribosomal protein S8
MSAQNNYLTSTVIDDEELIEELRRYGEKNLPIVSSTGSTRDSSKKKRLSDQNREIYMKKLNHHRAREKAGSNPSKHYIKQKRSNDANKSSQANSTRLFKYENVEDREDDDNDIIEIGATSTNTSEYVHVNHMHTSPLSNITDYDYETNYNEPESTPYPYTRTTTSSTDVQPQIDLNYVKLKDKIELDKTLSKYRSEINSIINQSVVRNRSKPEILSSTTADTYSDDVVYAGSKVPGTTFASFDNKSSRNEDQTQVLYCPKPSVSNKRKSIFDIFRGNRELRSENRSNADSKQSNVPAYRILNEIRGGRIDIPTINNQNSNTPNEQYLLPVKESITNKLNAKLFPFITNIGLQLSKLLPYLVAIIFTIIIMQYVRMKFVNSPSSQSDASISRQPGLNEDVDYLYKPIATQQADSTNKAKHFYCSDIKDTQCSDTKLLIREIIHYLRIKSGQVDCSSITIADMAHLDKQSAHIIEKSVHINQIVDQLKKQGFIKKIEHRGDAIESSLESLAKNPHWGVRLLNSSYLDTNQVQMVTYLMSTISNKSFICRFKELIELLYTRAVIICLLILTVGLLYLVGIAINKRRAERNRTFYELVGKVVAMVEKQYELSLLDPLKINPYIAISHIYDTLVDPSQRASQKNLWNKIVKFIQDHESRIHLETQFINGEETHVWRWCAPKTDVSISNTYNYISISQANGENTGLTNNTMMPKLTEANDNSSTSTEQISTTSTTAVASQHLLPFSNTAKENNAQLNDRAENNSASGLANTNGWQGDAFNRIDKLSHSPTSCLKIRNMFDQSQVESDPYFSVRIHNDIFKKCSQSNSDTFILNTTILHIACDKKSKEGCVYVKFISNEAAGRAYQLLNGTWYNGKLLNVKFLRSDRYNERFPDAINYNQPLKPIVL